MVERHRKVRNTWRSQYGKGEKLLDFRGKVVVLEWTNRPYTQKHYNSGNMQRLQKEWKTEE